MVSKYYWYRNGWPAERLREGRISSLRRRRRRWYLPNLADRVWLSRLLPVTAWALVYPLKPGAHFLCDDNGDLGVDVFVAYSRLQADFTRIVSGFGYTPAELQMPRVNTARYEAQSLPDDLLGWVVRKRMPADHTLNARAESE
jgi:hypothetical protein